MNHKKGEQTKREGITNQIERLLHSNLILEGDEQTISEAIELVVKLVDLQTKEISRTQADIKELSIIAGKHNAESYLMKTFLEEEGLIVKYQWFAKKVMEG